MIPYYDELVNGLSLPVIDKNSIDHSLDNNTLDDSFFIKYNELFEVIDKLKNRLDSIIVDDKELSNPDFNSKKFYFSKLKRNIISTSMLEIDSVSTASISKLEEYLILWGENIDSLYNLGLQETTLDEHINIMKLFNEAVAEIAEKRKKLVSISLPNNWLITSRGYLYNTESTKHSSGHFREHYLDMNERFLNGEISFNVNPSDNSKIDLLPELNHPEIISNNGYVRNGLLDIFLHYVDYIEFNGKVFDPRYIKIIGGIIELEMDYYRFLKKLYLYTNNPHEELKKVIELTKNNYDDVLIRCCGVSKAITKVKPIIVTSESNYEREFEKYLVNGWDISYITPLTINKEKGIVEEQANTIMKIRRL